MAGLTAAFETSILKLLMQNVTAANIGDATGLVGSTADGVFYVSLHTADPDAGNQTTSEAAYTNYARVSVVRTASGWAVAGNAPAVADNVAAITFASSGSGPESETHFGIGTDASGAGNLVASGPLDATLVVNIGIVPEFAIGAANVTLA